MWIFTTHGFYSVVQYDQDHSKLMVRARKRRHLTSLQNVYPDLRIAPLVSTPNADYPYRLIVDRFLWLRIVSELTYDIDYPNFKEAVGEDEKALGREIGIPYRRALLDVWQRMRRS